MPWRVDHRSTCVGGAPPPAPHAPRRAHAHLPCPSRAPPRAILCPIASQLTACVCPESCRSRRELSNEVLYVYWGRVFCLEMRSKSQNFPPGLRPGPRDETPSPDAPPRRQVQPGRSAAEGLAEPVEDVATRSARGRHVEGEPVGAEEDPPVAQRERRQHLAKPSGCEKGWHAQQTGAHRTFEGC